VIDGVPLGAFVGVAAADGAAGVREDGPAVGDREALAVAVEPGSALRESGVRGASHPVATSSSRTRAPSSTGALGRRAARIGLLWW
jgi:hypothetical protein